MKKVYALVTFCLAGFHASTLAIEPLTTSELLTQCAEYSANTKSNRAQRCESYIQGYIGGAYAMQTIAITDLPKKQSDFVERAQRTRVGNIESDARFGVNNKAGYCLPATLTVPDFIKQLNKYATTKSKHNELANQFILNFLQKEYACKADQR